jgi:hypothetical protein
MQASSYINDSDILQPNLLKSYEITDNNLPKKFHKILMNNTCENSDYFYKYFCNLARHQVIKSGSEILLKFFDEKYNDINGYKPRRMFMNKYTAGSEHCIGRHTDQEVLFATIGCNLNINENNNMKEGVLTLWGCDKATVPYHFPLKQYEYLSFLCGVTHQVSPYIERTEDRITWNMFY